MRKTSPIPKEQFMLRRIAEGINARVARYHTLNASTEQGELSKSDTMIISWRTKMRIFAKMGARPTATLKQMIYNAKTNPFKVGLVGAVNVIDTTTSNKGKHYV